MVVAQEAPKQQQAPARRLPPAVLDAVRTGRRPEEDAQAGLAAVRTGERIEQAMGKER